MKRKFRVLAILLAMMMLLTLMPLTASAASTSSFKRISTEPVKAGDYYYKVQTDSEGYPTNIIMRSTKKSSGYSKVLSTYETVYANGKYLYTVYRSQTDNFYLVRYNAAGKSRKVLKKLPKYKDAYYWDLATISGKYVFLTRGAYEKFRFYTYRFNTSTKSFKKVKDDCQIFTQSNAGYVLANRDFETMGIVAGHVDLYKISSVGKLSRVKGLGNHVSAAFIGKSLYYVFFQYDASSDSAPATAKVYKCSRSGGSRKLLGSIKKDFDGSMLYAEDFTSTSCRIYIGEQAYLFDYATGTYTEIS